MRPDPQELVTIPSLSALSAEELQRVASWLEVRHADAGERLVSEGASGYSFFILQEGTAVVTKGEEELRELGPGDFFGELAIAGYGLRTATVIATSPVKLLAMFGTELRRLESELPDAADKIRHAAAERLARQ